MYLFLLVTDDTGQSAQDVFKESYPVIWFEELVVKYSISTASHVWYVESNSLRAKSFTWSMKISSSVKKTTSPSANVSYLNPITT